MKKTVFVIAACGLMALGGCVPLSLHPYYTDKDLVSRPELVGAWNPGEADETVTIEPADGNRYVLTDIDQNGEVRFDCRLFEMDGRLFMDLYPVEVDGEMNALLEIHLIPGHSLLRVEQIGPTLKTASLSLSWLEAYLKEDPKALAHIVADDRVVITAPTEDIQAFVKKHVNDEDAFDEPSEMPRAEKR